jgi:hypothetical protein
MPIFFKLTSLSKSPGFNSEIWFCNLLIIGLSPLTPDSISLSIAEPTAFIFSLFASPKVISTDADIFLKLVSSSFNMSFADLTFSFSFLGFSESNKTSLPNVFTKSCVTLSKIVISDVALLKTLFSSFILAIFLCF